MEPALAPKSAQPVVPRLRSWEHARRRGVAALNRLEELARTRGEDEEAGELRAASERLSAGRLNLAVLGEFKRGKSTLINSLLGADVLPVGVIPMTSLPLAVEHGEEPAVEVELESGERLQLAPSDLPRYATESGNPGNRLRVARVTVRHPASILAPGVVLVDTPGIGSVHDHNTEAAYRALRQADAAIFVFSVDSPASRAELDFLAAAREQVSRVIFVLNKSDQVTAEELEQAVHFVQGELARALDHREVRLRAISARERGPEYLRFVQELEEFLVGERAEFLLERARAVALRALASERRALEIQRAALLLSEDELRRRAEDLASRLAEVSRHRVETEEVLHGDIGRLVAGVVDPEIARFREAATEDLEGAIRELADSRSDHLGEQLDGLVRERVSDLALAFVAELGATVGAALAEVSQRHAGRANRLLEDAVAAIRQTLSVDLGTVQLPERIGPAGERVVLVDDQKLALEVVAAGVRRLTLGRGGVVREAGRRGAELLDRQCGRIRYDLVSRLSERELAWRRELRGALGALETSVDRATVAATEARSQGEVAVAAGMTRLQAWQAELDELGRVIEPTGPASATLEARDWPAPVTDRAAELR